ncbi:hypothetical protein O0L34_g4706 [Tuta absoluta]|nr:hypothetical protein O0L34_g4706 [Tuta absoluta]
MPQIETKSKYEFNNTGHMLVLTLKNTTIKKIFDCNHLEELTIKDIREDQILNSDWLNNCGSGLFRKLWLESLSPVTVQRLETTLPLGLLETIIIQNCSLVQLPYRFIGKIGWFNPRKFKIALPYNHLEDTAFFQFPILEDLAFLDLSYNRLTGECLKYILPNVGGYRNDLRNLILDGNNFTDIFDDYEIKTAFVNKSSLQYLSLKLMPLEPHSLSHMQFKWLQRLDLHSNSNKVIENLQLHNLPSTGDSQLTIDLSGYLVRSVSIGPNYTANFSELHEPGHWLTSKGYKLVVFLDFIDCDCNNDVLQYALKEFPEHLYMPAMRCNSKTGGLFLDEPEENLSCRKASVHGCRRMLSRDVNYTTVVDCSRNVEKFRWPKPQRFRGLNATGNNISSLNDAYLPRTLEWLDLRQNNISILNAEEIQLLFGTSNRRIWLDGNPIPCLCENHKLLEAMLRNHLQIVDYEDIKCSGGQTFIKDISVFEICKSGIVHGDYRTLGIVKDTQEKKIHCAANLDDEKPFTTKTIFHTLTINECIMPRMSLADTLTALNIDVNALKTLKLINVRMPDYIPKNYSTGLSIFNLELIRVKHSVTYTFFQYQESLRRLLVKDMRLPGLAGNSGSLLELTVENSTVPFWSNCRILQTLTLVELAKEQIPNTYDANCTGALRYLFLKDMSSDAAMKFIKTVNESSLIEFRVRNCSLVEHPLKLMSEFDRLDVLDFSYNNLEDQAFSQFPDLKSLKILNLGHNKLKGDFLLEVVPKIPELQELVLDGNLFVHTFQNFQIKTAITSLPSLEKLSLNNMTLDAECFMYSNFSKLKQLEMRSNDEQRISLKLHGLPRTAAEQLTVDLGGRSFRSVEIDNEFHENFENRSTTNFWITNKGHNLVVLLDYVDCICNNDVLSTTLRDFSGFISMPGLRCDSKNGTLFAEEPLERLNCYKANVHGCRRRISRHFDYVSLVDCSYNTDKFRWPRPDKDYRSLNASGNNVTSLRNAYIPNSLKWLDLSNNRISRLDGNQSALLFNTTERRVWLSGNPISCQCDNHLLLNALRTKHSQIMDYDALVCAESGQPLRLVSIDGLCRFKAEYVWGSFLVLAVLALVTALLLRHYWISLRMYLYARGYCLTCLREEDVDEDRPYDAFISFAHEDYQYVMEQLLPELEAEPNLYRVCVHHRNWAVGEWIPAQIMQSVRLSKRTIIVLSKSFVTSLWGAMEFRYALASVETEGRSRLLVLVLDDVLSENLAPELRNYLNLNTYLKCDDPWFWEKLRFAMPRIQRSAEKNEETTGSDSHSVDQILMQGVESSQNHSPVNGTNEDVIIRTIN